MVLFKKRVVRRVRVVSDGPYGHNAKVFIDGNEITSMVRGLKLKMRADGIHELVLEMLPGSIDVDIEAKVKKNG